MKKLLATLLASTMCLSALGGLAACGGEEEDGKGVNLVVWCTDAAVPCYTQLANSFKAANPDIINKVSFTRISEADAVTQLKNDPTKGGDIFFFASDQVTDLMNNNLLQELPANYATAVTARDGSNATPVTVGSKIYAFPNSNSNGYFLYYDTRVFNAEQVKSLDTMIEIATRESKSIMFNYNDGFYAPTFHFGLGLTCGVAPDAASSNIDIDTEKGLAASKTFVKYFGTGEDGVFAAFGGANDAIANGIAEGDVCAGVIGTWGNSTDEETNKTFIEKALEAANLPMDTVVFTKLPKFKVTDCGTLDGEYQMGSFSGAKFCGVNPTKSEQKILAALMLADWFNNEAGQIARFQATKDCPTNTNAANSDAVKAEPMLAALAAQNAACSVAQLYTPEGFWNAWTAFGNDVYGGTTTLSNISTANAAFAVAILNAS